MKSLVIPVYRNAENIPHLVDALTGINAALHGDFEVVFVIDGSPDNSGDLLVAARPAMAFKSQIIFHSRNFGSLTAIRTGLEYAAGDLYATMAADLQEPPELIVSIFEALEADRADMIFGRRVGRDDPPLTRFLSHVFWTTFRKVIMPEIPQGGVEIFGCNRVVRDAVMAFEEPNSSLLLQLFWVGYRRDFIDYRRLPRLHGKSSWSLSRRFRYMMDSILSFSDVPIMVILWLGVIGCAASLLVGLLTIAGRLTGMIDETGYTTLVLLVLFFGSMSLVVQGVIGSYLWRTAENTKRRPLRLISRVISERTDDKHAGR